MAVKTNYFSTNQADLVIPGGNVATSVSPKICTSAGEMIEIYVQATPEIEVEDTVISIRKNGVEVARADADDWEEPSSLSAFFRETATGDDEYEVFLLSRIDDTILPNSLQIAVK